MHSFTPTVPLPERSPEMQPFWDACRAGKLLISRCEVCGQAHWSRPGHCSNCNATEFEWVKATGRGTLYSYVIAHEPNYHEGINPHIIAVVQLDEGPQVMALLVIEEFPTGKLRVNMPVEVVFGEQGSLLFRLSGQF